MGCWPSNLVGIFFIFILIVDLSTGDIDSVPVHGLLGIIGTLLFWGLCNLVGETISGGILVVPSLFLLCFLATMWLVGETFKKRKCCMSCLDPLPETCTPPPPPEPTCKSV